MTFARRLTASVRFSGLSKQNAMRMQFLPVLPSGKNPSPGVYVTPCSSATESMEPVST